MSMSLPLIFLQLVLAWLLGAASMAASQALSGCENRCGNISIPYPFGTREGCYINSQFLVTCNAFNNPPKLWLRQTNIEVTDIFLWGGLRISSWISYLCYNARGGPGDYRSEHNTLCLSFCDTINAVINGSCSSIGCCQTSIPKEVRSFNITIKSYDNRRSMQDFNPCSYAFIAEEAAYNFSSLDLANLQNREKLPVMLDWAVGNETCDEARKNQTSYACKENSECYNFDNGPGYRCNCSEGYDGNPYLSNGCQDIDECMISSPCNMTCHNLPGTYNCSCPKGFEGDGRKHGSGCRRIPSKRLPLVNIAFGRHQHQHVNATSWWLLAILGIKTKENQQTQKKWICKSFEIYTEECLKKATNNYHESRILGQGGQATVYKGILPDDTPVAIKKPKMGTTARDIKSNNILLDENFTAKVSDFGASRLFPTDQKQVATFFQGTLGYLDPEYLYTNQLTEKSDVYSFGVLLVELLTGEEALSYDRPPKRDKFGHVLKEGKAETLKEFAIVAKGCLEVKGDERPTMMDVATELQGLRMVEKHPWVTESNDAEEAQSLLGELSMLLVVMVVELAFRRPMIA
ncbi:wall associated kinase 5 [Actinidia rufa]|uniref:Wall associated kinase 5 n=1 Tax=Actinidia rufa TaxID=165716 RepID=A0A7J0DH32_9ERIC|nr:wall associated kinase 5 [Actinidia rufa]